MITKNTQKAVDLLIINRDRCGIKADNPSVAAKSIFMHFMLFDIVIDEAHSCSKGSNSEIIYLDYFFTFWAW